MFNKFMQEALNEAEKSLHLSEVPVGAVVVKDGIIIGRGHNLKETSNDGTMHAEIIAIKNACRNLNNWRLSDCDLFVTLEPCPMCAGAIIETRIRRVYIGAENANSGAAGTVYDILGKRSLNSTSDIYFGIMEEECKNLLKNFFEKLR
ncbi:nucleoside deaminase [Aceticella autotrophica]|uniref:tRNA-specific adenosine deaminase n=1 Tax=Aceticella autotrophica TaxID=2755338 RepID=A0A975GAQ1_9THEO|nr:nucleoside deaminase [Aceticella autotrophica]QSZ27401.1 nucleoside deaminase [Aceticella autotrophica]